MPESATQDVKLLFKMWRSGDADAGQVMAQRFSDWYYAISVMRLGDGQARTPLETACQIFASRIMDVTSADDLVGFAHQIVLDQVDSAGGRIAGGDYPNAITANRSPTQSLKQAAEGLPTAQTRMLHEVFSTRRDLDELDATGEGMPYAVLRARLALKQWLSVNARVPFTVLAQTPDPDRGPLPLYEANRLQQEEESVFEQWLLNDLELCKDVVEFAAFAHALRAGALAPSASTAPPPDVTAPSPPSPPTPDRSPEEYRPSGGGMGKIIGGLLAVFLLIGAIVLFMLMRS